MKTKKITAKMLQEFRAFLLENEKSKATLAKYLHDVQCFITFAAEKNIDKALMLEYKAMLGQQYAAASANSMIAALNAFLRQQGWYELCIRQFRVQKSVYCSEEKELTKAEYRQLLRTAEQRKDKRLSLVLQTICCTGIRVSELACITVEDVRRGEATVRCKGKTRSVFIVRELQRRLLQYAAAHGLTQGPVFLSRRGTPLSRCMIWREMKALCAEAGVPPTKVFPHNLRHLFARTFYGLEKDIAKLADILGHSSIDTTRIYIVTTGTEHRRKMENLHLLL